MGGVFLDASDGGTALPHFETALRILEGLGESGALVSPGTYISSTATTSHILISEGHGAGTHWECARAVGGWRGGVGMGRTVPETSRANRSAGCR